jgi:hypothetical protein
MDDQLALHDPNLNLIDRFVISIALIIVSVGLLVKTQNAVGLVGVMIGLLILVLTIDKFFDTTPLVIVDSTGIKDFRTKLDRIVPWEHVDRIWVTRYRYINVLCVLLRDRENYIPQMTRFERSRTADEWAVWGHMSFLFDNLSVGTNDVWDYISALNTTGKIEVKTEARKTSHKSREYVIPRFKMRRIL